MSARRVWRIVAAVGCTGAVTAAFHAPLRGANATTVGFAYLLAVLGTASWLGFPEALAASLAATAQYNYYFLPPEGTFTIQDPRNWVALGAFLATATVASQLSAAAKRRAAEAEQRRAEMGRLYALTRASLLADPTAELDQTAAQLERALVGIFGFEDAWIEMPGRHPAAGSYPMRWRLHVGQRELGALLARGAAASPSPLPAMSGESSDAIAGIVAIALERSRVMRESSRLEGLRASEQLKAALLDSVTHDIRTPLTAIKAAVTALQGEGAETAERRDLLAVIDEESDALNRLVQNLLDMARIEAGELRPRLREEALAPMVEAAVERARIPAERVEWRVEADLPPARVDGALISQAVGQLVANAAAYAPAGSRIEIGLRREGGQVVVEIRNAGPGVGAESLARIFEKFYRDPRARRMRPEGLGMGLAIARGIAEAHGGRLTAESAEGAGMRVSLWLPAGGRGDGDADLDRG